MTTHNQSDSNFNKDIASQNASRDSNDTARQRGAVGNREAVAVPSNTATNNSINQDKVKFLRWGIDSLYLSYQGN